MSADKDPSLGRNGIALLALACGNIMSGLTGMGDLLAEPIPDIEWNGGRWCVIVDISDPDDDDDRSALVRRVRSKSQAKRLARAGGGRVRRWHRDMFLFAEESK